MRKETNESSRNIGNNPQFKTSCINCSSLHIVPKDKTGAPWCLHSLHVYLLTSHCYRSHCLKVLEVGAYFSLAVLQHWAQRLEGPSTWMWNERIYDIGMRWMNSYFFTIVVHLHDECCGLDITCNPKRLLYWRFGPQLGCYLEVTGSWGHNFINWWFQTQWAIRRWDLAGESRSLGSCLWRLYLVATSTPPAVSSHEVSSFPLPCLSTIISCFCLTSGPQQWRQQTVD
jgi:hypothetical protein